MNKAFLSAIGAACALSFSLSASAVPIEFDFSGTPTGGIGTTTTSGGVTATSWIWDGSTYTDTATNTQLYRRNSSNDHGIGVCSTDENCSTGDFNELSNRINYELIRLDKGTANYWDQLWISSLDSTEAGTLYWGNDSDIATLLTGSSYTFNATNNNADIERDLLDPNDVDGTGLFDAGFFATAQYVLFTPGITQNVACNSTATEGDQACGGIMDNDYLVWKGATVPAPAVLGLMSIGLLGVGAATKRRNRKH